jgi:hypothetical protein
LSSPNVRSGYRGRARGELGVCGASDWRPNVGDDELGSGSTGNGLHAGMALSGPRWVWRRLERLRLEKRPERGGNGGLMVTCVSTDVAWTDLVGDALQNLREKWKG